MTEKINFLHLWKIELLIRFMLDDSPIEHDRQCIAIAEDDGQASPLIAVLNQVAGTKIKTKPVFKVDFDKCNVAITKEKSVSESEIREYLCEYFKNYEEDNVVDYDIQRNHHSYATQYYDFLNSIDNNLNLKDYKIEARYLPVVLVGYFKDLVKINSYELDLPLKKDYANDNVSVIERFYDEDDFDTPVLLQDFMSMRFKADISQFVGNKTTAKIKKTKTTNIKFSKAEELVLKKINKLKADGESRIYVYYLEEILASKINKNKKQKPSETISKVMSNLNTRYEKLHNKKLLSNKYRETMDCDAYYEIL